VPLGTTVEVVLLPGLGETVESASARHPRENRRSSMPPEANSADSPRAEVWSFQTLHAGLGYLRSCFGFRVCQEDGALHRHAVTSSSR